MEHYCSICGRTRANELLDSATQEYKYQMKECHTPIITESEVRAVQQEKKKQSNIVTDDEGRHRSSKKYSSKKK